MLTQLELICFHSGWYFGPVTLGLLLIGIMGLMLLIFA